MKIYLSPSTQNHNAYARSVGGTEEHWMRAVSSSMAPLLSAAGHTVLIGGSESASDNVAQGNAWGADLYLALHSNAGGGHGTEIWYFTGSADGKVFAAALYARIVPVSRQPDRGIKATDRLIEVRGPETTAALVEFLFHDDDAEAAEMRDGYEVFAQATVSGILDYIGRGVRTRTPLAANDLAPRDPLIGRGCVGNAVRLLQRELVERGEVIAVDGLFGPLTQRAVEHWQTRAEIQVDGICGPQTWSSLGH